MKEASFGLGPRSVHSVLAAYVYSGDDAEVAGRLAKQLCRRKSTEAEPKWSRLVEDLFLKMEHCTLESLLDPCTDQDVRSV